ncbi:helix-turn-helix domain-containing protein [Chitinophaga eiseniae]|uniref:Helix-turn-helix domain-containing protein n=1 Tax=Chitinophaga eiseniae TaxID=634771 RepID=A0A847SQ91_9BACT|nr:AraC family transcriptional regulator [Chitinophaga eiseniae]NLR78232.1 helix-turn-helix domain-containing protein [Chitinophaga eiseniae]
MHKIPVRYINEALKEPGFSGGFSMRSLEDFMEGQDMLQALHRHTFYYVLVLEKASGEHTIDFTPYPVKDNTVFFMRPGQIHQLFLENGSRGYLLHFTDDFYAPAERAARQVLRSISTRNCFPMEQAQFSRLYQLLEIIHREYTEKQERYKQAIKSALDMVFLELLRQGGQPQPSDERPEYMQERLDELLELVEKHLPEHKQVAFYAAELHLSSYQLNTVTKTLLGKSCSALINDMIILEARRQLLATSNQVNQVAAMLGYEDVSYFIRFFKKHTGFSPEAFRSNFK